MEQSKRERYLDAETEAVYKEYSEFLDAAGLPYNNNQNGFHVCLEMEHKTLVRYINFEGKGMMLGYGCGSPGMTGRSRYPQEAYQLGSSL